MDARFRAALNDGLDALGLASRVSAESRELLERFSDRLLFWNRRVNLTAITDPAEVAEKHLVDSLALLPDLERAKSLLDVGSGAGIPAVPIACVLPTLDVTCCDAVAKKMAFVKAVAAELDLRVRAVAARAEGEPRSEGLPLAEVVVSRAFAEPERWLPLGGRYLAEGGRLLAMLGREVDEEGLRRIASSVGLEMAGVRRFTLPLSGSERAIARFARAGNAS